MAPPTNAPPAQDTSRNEYIPSFIASKPFYVTDDLASSDADYLEHQRLHSAPKDTLDKAKWYDRGKKLGPAATKFRKGACENCGAMTHKTKECLNRPRKTGAKYTGRDIQADERVESVSLGWDAKRDRWNGYDSKEYDSVVKEYEELEALKKSTATAGSPDQKTLENGGESADNDARYDAETDMGRSQPTSTRQLRLREDTAGYLKNLDLDSAAYDPKTRTLDASTKTLASADADLADQGFMRPSEAEAFERAQRYAWEAQENGAPNATKLHLQANPTEGAMLMRKAEAEATSKKDAQKKYLLDRYGSSTPDPTAAAGSSSEHSKPSTSSTTTTTVPTRKPPRAISTYIEYDSRGLPKNAPKAPAARSKYPEDVHPNNHTSVFGSWWADFAWGYRCCHSTVRNSWCAGEEGKSAVREERERKMGTELLLEAGGEGEEEGEDEDKEGGRVDGDDGAERVVDQDGGEGEEVKAKNAKKRPREENASSSFDAAAYTNGGVSEEAMEQYKRSKLSAQDPMAGMLGRDELVD